MSETADNLSFEKALERLETVVRELESDETGLDQSLAHYEEGVRLLKRCREILDSAEQKIRLLSGVDADGNPITQPFDATLTVEQDTAASREPGGRPGRSTRRSSNRAGSEPTEGGGQLF